MRISLFLIGLATLVVCDEEHIELDPVVVIAEKHIPEFESDPLQIREMRENDKLLFAQVVWRHGDRAPTGTYPTDVHQESAWKNGWGELTQLGMRQQYSLGRLLYNRYVNTSKPLLSSTYNSKEVYIRSTDVNRTLVSAYSNLAGMFENGHQGDDYPNSGKWPNGWTPIPVHTIPENMDPIGNVFSPCPRADELYDQIRASQPFTSFKQSSESFLKFLSENTGMKVDVEDVYLINDVNYIEKIYNMSQPEWITEQVELRLRDISRIGSKFLFGIGDPYVPEMIRLRGGPLLKAMVTKMSEKISCHKKNNAGHECKWIGNLKYHAYSAHDTTVYALLTTFGDEEKVISGGMPHYTASIDIELWDLEDIGLSVRVLFHSAFHHKYHVITHLVKGCPQNNEFCPWKTFEERSALFMPVNWEKECRRRNDVNRVDFKLRSSRARQF